MVVFCVVFLSGYGEHGGGAGGQDEEGQDELVGSSQEVGSGMMRERKERKGGRASGDLGGQGVGRLEVGKMLML